MGYPTLPDFMDLGEFLFDEGIKVLGPYAKTNGRQFVIVHNYVYTKTITYSRYLWMTHHQRVIPEGYEVDHIDDNPSNNEISNLQLLTTDENNRKRDKNLGYSSDGYTFNCPVCGTERTIKMWIYRQNQIVKGQPGPYCSKSCSVKARYN